MAAYYNEHDPPTAAWLRELIKAGLIADGDVDERSVVDVRPADLAGFAQCHFFAGIGGWSYALRLAGVPDDAPVWTGSCPCQPFSAAGRGDGEDDSRDLWPAWARLIRECRPHLIFGEQVEAAARGGWFDRLCADLEGEDYAVGACVLGAHSVGAYHIRQRLWFVAESNGWHAIDGAVQRGWEHGLRAESRCADGHARDAEWAERVVADADGERRTGQRLLLRPEETRWDAGEVSEVAGSGKTVVLGDAHQPGSQGRQQRRDGAGELPAGSAGVAGELGKSTREQMGRTGQPRENFWRDCDWLPCRDGKARPVESGTFPLAHGVPARVGRLRGYGNAIVPQVAAEFIRAYLA